MNIMNGYKKLSREEESDLHKKMQKGDMKARDQLYKSCVPWAVNRSTRIAKQCYGPEIDEARMDDMIQAGLFGLLQALNRFDPARSRLTTYSRFWIIKECLEFAWNDKTIHIPRYQSSKRFKGPRFQPVISLDIITHYEHGSGGLNCLPKSLRYIDKGFEAIDNADNGKLEVKKAMEICLTIRERDILIQRSKGKTLKQVGDWFGITRERVRQLQSKALEKLRIELNQ